MEDTRANVTDPSNHLQELLKNISIPTFADIPIFHPFCIGMVDACPTYDHIQVKLMKNNRLHCCVLFTISFYTSQDQNISVHVNVAGIIWDNK